MIEAIQRIDALRIKGLGPAVANLLYFIHPTLVVPFNTAIVRGYSAVTGGYVKPGSPVAGTTACRCARARCA